MPKQLQEISVSRCEGPKTFLGFAYGLKRDVILCFFRDEGFYSMRGLLGSGSSSLADSCRFGAYEGVGLGLTRGWKSLESMFATSRLLIWT